MAAPPPDDLSGRTLDAAVARHVFGLEVEERTSARTGEKDFVYAARPDAPKSKWVRVPFYAASLGASITVEVELQKRGWRRVAPQWGSHWNLTDDPNVILEHTDGRRVQAWGHNEALCRAALKAVQPP